MKKHQEQPPRTQKQSSCKLQIRKHTDDSKKLQIKQIVEFRRTESSFEES